MKINDHTLANPKNVDQVCHLIRDEGFIYTNQDVQNMLRCSRSYLNKYIRPYVDHVITSIRIREEMEPFFNHIREGKPLDGYILYSMDSLNAWFRAFADVSRQTIKINMYPYIKDKEKFMKAYREERLKGTRLFFFSNARSMVLSDHLSKKGLWILSHSVRNRAKRSDTEAVPLDNFLDNIKFEDIYKKLRRPREIQPNDERARQVAFHEGMIKIFPENDLLYYYDPHDMLFSEFPNYSITIPYRFYLDNEEEIRDIQHQSYPKGQNDEVRQGNATERA